MFDGSWLAGLSPRAAAVREKKCRRDEAVLIKPAPEAHITHQTIESHPTNPFLMLVSRRCYDQRYHRRCRRSHDAGMTRVVVILHNVNLTATKGFDTWN